MAKEKIELSLQDESGQECVAYPFVESTDVSLSNGMDIETMIAQDVSLPTIVHSETSFKAGVGDSDVSNSIVDSSVASMTIKGQTYQNILPEPSLRNTVTDGKTMQKLNEGFDNVNTIDGVGKGAILKGQTLVNLISDVNGIGSNVVFDKDGYITLSKENLEYMAIYLEFPYKVTENSKHLLIMQVKENTLDGRFRTTTNSIVPSGVTIVEQGKIGVVCHVLTCNGDNMERITLRTDTGSYEGSITFRPMLIPYQDGMENWDIPYFEGMQSVEAPSVKTVGKNLFDIQSYFNLVSHISGASLVDGGLKLDASINSKIMNNITKIYLNVDLRSDKQYHITYNLENEGNLLAKPVIQYVDGGTQYVTSQPTNILTTELNRPIEGIGWTWSTQSGGGKTTISNLQIEEVVSESTTPTTYEPYKSTTLKAKNILQSTALSQGCINADGSLETSSSSVHVLNSVFTEIIPVTPNTEYYIATEDDDITYDRIAYYNSSKTFMRRSDSMYSLKSKKLMIPSDTYYIRIAFYKGAGVQITPQQLGNVVCQEIVKLRSLPNGVCDTLNLVTGEYVQRIGEITFKNQTAWEVAGGYPNLYYYNTNDIGNANIYVGSGAIPNLYCDKMAVTSYSGLQQSTSGVKISNRGKEGTHSIAVYNSDITNNVVDFKAWLTQNPFTVQYELATPVVKTVDLSSSGNWEKVVLDGSENWARHGNYGSVTRFNVTISNMATGQYHVFSDKFPTGTISTNDLECVNNHYSANQFQLQIKTSRLASDSVDGLKQYLSQKPITVWYQTATHQDSTNVKEMLSFSNGHVQLSSAEGSLIPSLNYETPTSNSYQLDLAKPSTKYTMKSSSASGNFTIDGTQYNFNTNGTFTTPSTMNNKLIIANGTVTDLMFIEGDVTSKTIPYFKGIKSAFEDESKIEVLSTGKNLLNLLSGNMTYNGLNKERDVVIADDTIKVSNNVYGAWQNLGCIVDVKPNTRYTFSITDRIKTNNGYNLVTIYHGSTSIVSTGSSLDVKSVSFTTPSDCNKITIRFYCSSDNTTTIGGTSTYVNPQLEESPTSTTYEPYKLNSTKIPLLSPLRSLPNGVCDELIVDRANNKAKIIQRVSEELMKLETPIITEIDLENFPLVYKDGHIFLNSEIAPVVEIDYSINQSQQIQSNNETLQRHELDILDLDNLIVSFVNAEYNLRLLKFNMELSMMALAE